MSYYYFPYSNISSQYANAIDASFNQLDPSLNGLSVAQCANYGISLIDDYDASFMVLTTDVSGVENNPRLEYYNPSSFSTDISAIFTYSPETSSNINKQVFCSKDIAYASLTGDICGGVPEDAIINDEAIEQYYNFPYDQTGDASAATYFEFPAYPGPDMSLVYLPSITSGTSTQTIQAYNPDDFISQDQTAIDASRVIVRKEMEISGNGFGFSIGTQATPSQILTEKRFVIGCYNTGRTDSSGIAIVYKGTSNEDDPFDCEKILNPLDSGDGTAGKSPVYSVSISPTVDGNCIIALGQPFDVSNVSAFTFGSTIESWTRAEGSVAIYYNTSASGWAFRTRLYAKGPSTAVEEQWNGWPNGGAEGTAGGNGYSQNGGFLFGWSVSCGSPYIVAVGAPHVRSIKHNDPSADGFSESPWSWAGQVYIYRVNNNQTWAASDTILLSCVYPPRLLIYSFNQPKSMNNDRLNPNPGFNPAGCGTDTGPFNESRVSEFGRKVSLQCLSTDSDNSNNLILVVGAPLYSGYAGMLPNQKKTEINAGGITFAYYNYYENWLELDSSAGAAWGTGCVCCYYSSDYGDNWSGGFEQNNNGTGIPTRGIHCGNGKIFPDQHAYRSLVTNAPRYPDIGIWGTTNIFPTPVKINSGGGTNVGGFFNNRNPVQVDSNSNYRWQVSATGIILNPAYGGNDSTFNASDIPGTGDGHTTKWGAAPTMFGYDIATSALGSNWSDGVGLIITSPGFVEPISSFVTHPGFRSFPNKIESISGPTLFNSQYSTSEYGNWYDASASVLETTGNKNTRIYIYKNSCTGFTGDTNFGGTDQPTAGQSGSGYSLLDSSYVLTATMEFNTNDFGAGGSISFVYPHVVVGWGPVSARDNIYSHNIFKYAFMSNSLEDPVETDKLFYNNSIGLSQNLNPENFGIVVALDPSFTFISSLPILQEAPTGGINEADTGRVSLIEWDVSLNTGTTKQVFFLEDISFANPILFDPETWTDNSNIPVTPSTYFQYSNKAGDSIDAITINAPQIADFSNNYSLCAQYASRFLGTGGINAAGEEKERKYFVLYADDTNTANRRIAFLSDISGAYFNDGSTGTQDISGRQIFCSVQDTSAVTDAYWDGTDMSMVSATPFYFDKDKWMKEAPSAPDTVMYYQSSNILDYTICEFPVGTFSSKDSGQMAEYANKFLGQTLVDASGIPRECKYYVLYTNDLSDNRVEFKYNYDNTPLVYYFGAGNGSYAGIHDNGSLGDNKIYKDDFPDLQDTEFINMMITNLKGNYLNSVAFVIDYTDNTRTDISYVNFKSSIDTLYDKSVGADTPSLYNTSLPSSLGQQVFVLDISNNVELAQSNINATLTGTVTENNAILYNSTISSYNSIPCVANTQVFCSSANALNIWNNKTALEWDYMVSPPVSDPADDDVLGFGVAVANNMVIGGAPGTSQNGSTNNGGRVLTWYTDNSGETWIEKTTINNPTPLPGAYFGRSVALSYITLSTYLACIAANQAANDGMVYIYKTTNNGDTWSITQELKGSDYFPSGVTRDRFGWPGVALKAGNYSDNILVVSAALFNSVFIFSANTYDSSWNIIDTLHDPGPLGDISSNSNSSQYMTRFGGGLAIDGSFVLIGAPGDATGNTLDIYGGAAYLFKIIALDSSLNLYQNLESFDISNGDTFGSSCSIDGNLCVIGCTKNPDSDISGAAYVFKETNDTSWNQTAKLTDYLEPLWDGISDPAPNFGGGVSIKNNIIIVGSSCDDYTGGYCRGIISIFSSSDEGLSWPQIRNLPSLIPSNDNRFGSSVALSDNYAVVGEPMFYGTYRLNYGAIYVIPKSLIVDTTCNISKAPLRVFTNDANWVDNCNDVSMTYFQYSNYAGATTKNIIITDSEIADFSNNFAKCAQYSSQFLGASAFDANSEIVVSKYFILYADDTNTANLDGTRRISFIKDISGAHFDLADLSGRQIFCQLGDTPVVNNAIWTGTDNSMSYSTPLYFTEEGWLKTTPTPPDSNFYFQWSDISGYNIFDLPIGELAGQAFDGSSIAQMASYGTSFLNKMLVDTEGVPRECKYFVLYTNDLSENRIQFKYDASGNNAGIFYSPKTQYYNGLNYNKQVFCSSANAIIIKEISNNNIIGGFDCSFANEIKFFEDKWADNNQLVAPPTSFFRTSNIVAQYDGSANPQVDIISYNAPQLTGIANNYGECAAYASKFLGTIGLTAGSEVLNLGIPSAISFEPDFRIWYFEGLSNSVISAALNINFTSYTARLYSSNGDSYFLYLSLNNPTSNTDLLTGEILEGMLLINMASGVDPVPDPTGLFPFGTPTTANWYFEYNITEEKERKNFILITDDTDPSSARIQFKYDGSGAYYDPNCGAGGLATNCQIFCPTTDVVPLQEAPGPDYDPYQSDIGTNTMANSHPRYFSG